MKCKWWQRWFCEQSVQPNGLDWVCSVCGRTPAVRSSKRFWRIVFYIAIASWTFNLLSFGALWYLK